MDDTNATPPDSGLFHTFPKLPNLSFKSAMNETVIQSSDSYIVLGTDRPGSMASGYGAVGSCAANSIDLVVGRGSSLNKGKGPAAGTILDNLFVSDAARINISQLTNIDLNFGLAPGSEQKAHGNSMPRSGIGIKADDIRILGRHSVKIITGKSSGYTGLPAKGETNSLGGKEHQPAPTIELIAGNHVESRIVYGGVKVGNVNEEINTLQRAAMGDNLRNGLEELVDIVGELWSATFNFILTETVYDGVVGVDPLRHWVPSAAIPDQILKADYVLNSLWQTKLNLMLWTQNHLKPHGYRYVCSSNVKLT
tara:strand:- start:168 stop:1094 length:927 start_codon:yes stop_codon:yes gene_type:complete